MTQKQILGFVNSITRELKDGCALLNPTASMRVLHDGHDVLITVIERTVMPLVQGTKGVTNAQLEVCTCVYV